jgi:hypothetical protein
MKRALLLLLLPILAASCRSVEFYEKQAFSDPAMAFDESAAETHFYQKTYYSMEGSAGGIGTTAGGGCGCY